LKPQKQINRPMKVAGCRAALYRLRMEYYYTVC